MMLVMMVILMVVMGGIVVMMIDRDVQESNGYLVKQSTLQVVDYVIERECELTQVKITCLRKEL